MHLTRTTAVFGLLAAIALTPAARAEPKVSDFRLENGMEVVVIEDHRAPVVTRWYGTGLARPTNPGAIPASPISSST